MLDKFVHQAGVCHLHSSWNDALEAGAMQLSMNGVDQVQWCFGSGGDGSGLNIKPSGRYEGGFMLFQHAGRNAYFWTSTSLEEFNSDWSDSRIVVSRGFGTIQFSLRNGLAF